jgi:acetylornithine deacetylase/succinyl-diaminopimelate desuccinylase-like protein
MRIIVPMPLRPLSKYHLGEWSRTALDRLVRTPSVAPQQVREKMALVKKLIGKEAFEGRIEDFWEDEPEGVPYLICQLGRRENADFTLFIPSHIDTVKPDPDWASPYQLTANPRDNDRLEGLGGYDEQSSVLNGIRLLREAPVPEGLCVYVAFVGDEEYRSHAARHIISHWPHFQSVDAVLSSEIGPLKVPEGDDVMRIILGRRGILKTRLHAKLVKGAGHGARPGMPSAYHELAQVYRLFNPDALDPLPADLACCAPHLRHHPLLHGAEGATSGPLGYEEVFAADVGATSEGLIRPQEAKANHKTLLVPPSTIASALRTQADALERLGGLRDWQARGIRVTLSQRTDSTSYSPFQVDPKHPFVGVVSNAIERVSHAPPVLAYGHSNADENLYAMEGGKPTLSVPIKGGGAHSPQEWVSASDIARNFIVFRFLIEQALDRWTAAKRSL